jgi:hypothetical protein
VGNRLRISRCSSVQQGRSDRRTYGGHWEADLHTCSRSSCAMASSCLAFLATSLADAFLASI